MPPEKELRRDVEGEEPEVQALKEALAGADVVVTTVLVLQEHLQGFDAGIRNLAESAGLESSLRSSDLAEDPNRPPRGRSDTIEAVLMR